MEIEARRVTNVGVVAKAHPLLLPPREVAMGRSRRLEIHRHAETLRPQLVVDLFLRHLSLSAGQYPWIRKNDPLCVELGKYKVVESLLIKRNTNTRSGINKNWDGGIMK